MGSKSSSSIIQRAYRYVKYDIPEIILPSSLPNPPGYIAPPPKTLREKWATVSTALGLYKNSWDPAFVQAQLRKQRGEDENSSSNNPSEADETVQELKALAAELKEVSRGGAHTAWPYLQNLYKTRVRAYREAVMQFIEGYKEGFQEANKPDVPPELVEEMEDDDEKKKREQK